MPATWDMPYKRNHFFTGREDIFHRLHTAASSRKVLASSGEALVGPGGIGKTHIAIEYVYRYKDAYQEIFWINASKGMNAGEIESLMASLKASSRWLLIVDQVKDLAQVKDIVLHVNQTGLNQTGHILATSRIPVPRLTTISVPPFSEEDAALCLLRYGGILGPGETLDKTTSTAQAYAITIARLLEGLPRALHLAAQSVKKTQLSLHDYCNEIYRKQYGIPPLEMILIDHLQMGQHVVYFEGDSPEIYVGRVKNVQIYKWGEVVEEGCSVMAEVILLQADEYRYLELEFFYTYLQRAVVPASEVFYQWPQTLPPQQFNKPKRPGHEVKIRFLLRDITSTSSEDR